MDIASTGTRLLRHECSNGLAGGDQLRWNRVVGAGVSARREVVIGHGGFWGVLRVSDQVTAEMVFGCLDGLQEWIASWELRMLLLEELVQADV